MKAHISRALQQSEAAVTGSSLASKQGLAASFTFQECSEDGNGKCWQVTEQVTTPINKIDDP